VLKGISTIKAHRISHVITSGPPFTTHLIGLVLKKWKGKHIRWIADFRDPWVANEQRTAHVTTSVSNYFNRLLEMQVITNADKVVCVTPSMTDWYRKRYPLVSDSVWQTITNGFESKEFNEIKLDRVRKRFTISYIGSIEYERSPVGLFRAVSELCREGVVDNRRISINFVGKCGAVEGRTITELIRQWNLEGIVQLMGLIPRSEALREMKSSHVLLLLANAQRLQVPGKAYEYMAAGPFILAVTEEHGATADFIRRVGGGAIVSSNDHQTLKAVLHNCYGEFIRRPLETINYGVSRPATILNEYAWNHLGERYARILVEG
jgi:glycosyltransferase involved in cell wall biosynthesis